MQITTTTGGSVRKVAQTHLTLAMWSNHDCLLDVTREEFVSKKIPKPDVDVLDAYEELCSNITIKLDERIGTGSLYLIRR